MTNSNLLKSHIAKKGVTMKWLADKIGLSNQSLSYKINNIREFKSSEIRLIQEALDISNSECYSIFFDNKVDL